MTLQGETMSSGTRTEKPGQERTVADWARAAWLYGVSVGSTVVFANTVLLSYPAVRLFDREKHALHRIGIAWAKFIVGCNPWWDFEIEGLENAAPDGQAVMYVANHQSQTDILAMFVLGVRFRWLSKESVFKVPFMGWAMRAIGYVSVKRGDKDSALKCFEESKAHLRHGTPMVFFPEGTRSRNGVMGSFKSGAFKLAQEVGVPVVPITLLDTDQLLPKGSVFPGKAKVRIIVHPPISPVGLTVDALMLRAREAIASTLPPERRGRQ